MCWKSKNNPLFCFQRFWNICTAYLPTSEHTLEYWSIIPFPPPLLPSSPPPLLPSSPPPLLPSSPPPLLPSSPPPLLPSSPPPLLPSSPPPLLPSSDINFSPLSLFLLSCFSYSGVPLKDDFYGMLHPTSPWSTYKFPFQAMDTWTICLGQVTFWDPIW